MFRLKKFLVKASEIAGYLNSELIGNDFDLSGPHNIRTQAPGPNRLTSGQGREMLIISSQPPSDGTCFAYIHSDNPELDLAYVLREFFASSPSNEIHPTAVISSEARIGRNVMVGAHAVIGPDVVIGDNTKIFNNVIINGPATIGKYCVIKDGAVVGSEGWCFVRDEDGIAVHTPQLGQIVIDDRVWIGSNCSIERAMVDETLLATDVKIDDLVHIGGGCSIGKNSQITAGTIVAHSVQIGADVVIGANAVIRERLTIHDHVMVGQGAVVVHDLDAGNIYIGNPARFFKPVVQGRAS